MGFPKFEVYESGSEYRFRLLAVNGRNILASEGYTTKHNCINGIDSVKTNAPKNERYDRRTARNGEYYFVLKARNGEIIGKSETYTTRQAMENGIDAVKRDAPVAEAYDLTNAS